jgi:hypothetical protein
MSTLLKVSVLVLGLLGMFLSMINMWGNSQRYQEFKSSFTTVEEKLYIAPWEQHFLLSDKPEWVLWVDVYRGANDLLLAKPWVERQKANSQIEQSPNPTRPLIAELLNSHPQRRFILNVTNNLMGIQDQISQLIDETKSEGRVMIQSPYNVILDTIKEKKPLLLYGSTPSDSARLATHESLWILSAAPFRGDVFISELKSRSVDLVSPAIVKELKRRFKKVILGPLATKEELLTAQSLGADGLFVEDPLLLQ